MHTHASECKKEGLWRQGRRVVLEVVVVGAKGVQSLPTVGGSFCDSVRETSI